MLHARLLLRLDGLTVADVRCRHRAGPGADAVAGHSHMIVLVRRGCFRRSANGIEALLDPTVAYAVRPGEEERYDHPHDHGDDCTSIGLDPELLASVWGGEPELPPAAALRVDSDTDLQHRLLVSALRRADDEHAAFEHALTITAAVLAGACERRVMAGRPSTDRTRSILVDSTREALAADPGLSLRQLAATVGASPHHLSRIFVAATGATVARHRMRLRARVALERLAAGDHDLARLAADTGFADQSHLCRIIRSETGQTPSALRTALAPATRASSTRGAHSHRSELLRLRDARSSAWNAHEPSDTKLSRRWDSNAGLHHREV